MVSTSIGARSGLPDPLRAAEAYDARIRQASGVRRLFRWLEGRAVARALTHAHGASILDCPCGTGRLDALLRARFRQVLGVDRSEAMLTVYRRGYPARVGEPGDAYHLPYAEETFDWAISHRMFHHVRADERRVALLQSLARVVRRGVIVYAWLETPFRRGRSAQHKSLSVRHVRRLLAQAGLELEAVYFAAWPLQPKAELVCRKR